MWARMRHEGGQFSVLLGLTILPLLAVVGFAIDVSRQVSLGRHVHFAADFASLAAARAMEDASYSDDEINAIAQDAYFAQLNTAFNDASCEDPTVSIERSAYRVSVTGLCEIPTLFGARVSSLDAVAVQRMAIAKAEMTRLEVALMLDISSSMDGARLDALKTATTNFVDSMVLPTSGTRVRVSLVPYGTSVNADIYGNRAMGRLDMDDRLGDGLDKVCVADRQGADELTDAAPQPGSWVEPVIPHNWLVTCPASGPVLPLTSNRTELIDAIEALDITEEQWTGGNIAVAWSWYTLSPNWRSIWPAAASPADYDDPDVQKIVVIMTDGEFNDYYRIEDPTLHPMLQSPKLCQGMHDAGIDVYTVGFDVDVPESSVPFVLPDTAFYVLSECASDEDKAYFPETGEDLIGVFEELSIRFNGTRLTG